MRIPEIVMKTGAIVLFGLGTILALYAFDLFGDDPQRGKQMATAAMVLFVVGGMFFVFPPVQDWLSPKRKRRRDSDASGRDGDEFAGSTSAPPADRKP